MVGHDPVARGRALRRHLRAPAGVQRFNWLGEDPAAPATLVRKFGSSTNGGAPTIPIPIPIPIPVPVIVDNGAGPVVRQEMQNPEIESEIELVEGGESRIGDDDLLSTDCASLLTIDTFEYIGPYDAEHAPTCDDLGGENDCTNFMGPRIATMMSAAIVELPGA